MRKVKRGEGDWEIVLSERIEEMGTGAGKHTGEFFRRRDAWRKHPMLGNQMRHATPGLGIALVAFGVYLVAEQAYNRINAPSSHHVGFSSSIPIFHQIICLFLFPLTIRMLFTSKVDSIACNTYIFVFFKFNSGSWFSSVRYLLLMCVWGWGIGEHICTLSKYESASPLCTLTEIQHYWRFRILLAYK